MKIRVGIIGYGTISSKYHRTALGERADRFELAAIHDTTPARQQAARNETDATVYDALDEFLATDIDLVLVAAPTVYHTELARAGLEAGKAVVVEKPMGMNASELEPLLAAARNDGAFLTVHHNRRWDPDYRTVRSIVERGEIGDVLTVESRANGLGAPHKYGAADYHPQWRLEAQYGGGKLNEWGSHLIDQALQWFGSDIDSVWGQLRNVGLSTEVDTYGKYVIGFSSGVLYHIETSWISPVPEPRWYVLGSEGAVLKATPNPDEPAQIVRRTDDGTNESTVDCIHTGGHGAFYDNLYEVLANGARSAVLPEEGALVTRVIEAVRESSRTGKAVRL